ncbi:hypothetical protein [Conexibacter sp. SYSU D00693]|uniref:hypothetical protein n=1 Tax=Conexibacter sp. SYSU D00693 TaxID=2812560 RepID=UPI00196A31C1|nr:hypothetical protein [Conexibacter sp. SYSU D00693]
MSLHHFPALPPVGAPAPVGPPAPAGGPAATPASGDFGRVLDLEAARARKVDLPDEVVADMTRASELVDRLAFEGRQVQFSTHELSGKVVAGLVDSEGALIRRLDLRDVVHGSVPGDVA